MQTIIFRYRVTAWGLLLLLVLLVRPNRDQFSTSAGQTGFVCQACGSQPGGQTFADEAGNSFMVWIDRRGGNRTGSGMALYA